MIYYIGGFPPPYGGVTVKNRDLYNAISSEINIEQIDLNKIKRKDLKETAHFLKCLINKDSIYIIGVAAHSRRKLTKLLYRVNKKAVERSILILMGGAAAREISLDLDYQKYVKPYKSIYAETIGMQKTLLDCGLLNTKFYPNCRVKPKYYSPKIEYNTKTIRPVFFSLIQPQKGVDIIIDSAKKLPEIIFTFYGPIDSDYKEEFMEIIKSYNNVIYKGVFKGAEEEVYNELSKYDVLLLPTKWDTEGVPGILVESKITGITCVVSNMSYNSELIIDGIQGIVLKENTEECLTESINRLNNDHQLLYNLKKMNHYSSKDYYLESYIEEFINDLNR